MRLKFLNSLNFFFVVDVGCLSVSSGYAFTSNEPLKMINKTDHSIKISWSVSAITGTICDSVSKPPLMFKSLLCPKIWTIMENMM